MQSIKKFEKRGESIGVEGAKRLGQGLKKYINKNSLIINL
jgi:hypothetical protein